MSEPWVLPHPPPPCACCRGLSRRRGPPIGANTTQHGCSTVPGGSAGSPSRHPRLPSGCTSHQTPSSSPRCHTHLPCASAFHCDGGRVGCCRICCHSLCPGVCMGRTLLLLRVCAPMV